MITVRVPATSANLGPGFDCFGIALGLYGTFSFEEREAGFEFEGVDERYCSEENLAVQAYFRALEEMGCPRNGLYLKIETKIPVSRGLGSSASLIAAGLCAANEAHGRPLDDAALLRLATELEGHPDNVAPALLGGLTVSWIEVGAEPLTMRYSVDDRYRFCALIPDFELSTERARAVLPRQISRADAIYNISRAAILIEGLRSGNPAGVACGMHDLLHQPYRIPLIDGYEAIRDAAIQRGALGVCISGAGPTILCVTQADQIGATFPERMNRALEKMRRNWQVLPLCVDGEGTVRVG